MQIRFPFIIILIASILGSMICEASESSGNNTMSLWDGGTESETVINLSNAEPLKLDDGYELAVKSVDIDGNKVYLELFKDGQVVDSKVIIAANKVDGNFIYTMPGTAQTIKVHFKNAFRGSDQNLVTVDRIQQTSEIDPFRFS
jgi:hypothetical protein